MRFILFYKIEVTNRYPVTTAICGTCATVVFMCIVRAWGWL